MKSFLCVSALAIACSALPLEGGKHSKADPNLENIQSIFIEGNNEVAVNARRLIDQYGSCMTVVGDKKDADAVFEIGQNYTSGGFGGGGRGGSTVGTGTLTSKDGKVLWSDSKQGANGMIHTGAGSAARHLLDSLFKATCGEKLGYKKKK